MANFKNAAIPIIDNFRKRLVELVQENLDALAASPTDNCRTSVVIHTIKTGKARLFKHKLRAILFARPQYLEQKVEHLMSVCVISSRDTGACPDFS